MGGKFSTFIPLLFHPEGGKKVEKLQRKKSKIKERNRDRDKEIDIEVSK